MNTRIYVSKNFNFLQPISDLEMQGSMEYEMSFQN